MRLAVLLKARPIKYIKRWRGKDGKWHYKYTEEKSHWYEKEVYRKGRILASLSRKYNVEFGSIIDLKTGTFVGGITRGFKNKVPMKKNVKIVYDIFKKDRKRRFINMHSHIHDYSFSSRDIFMLLHGSRVGIKKSVVYGSKGSIYELEVPDKKVYKWINPIVHNPSIIDNLYYKAMVEISPFPAKNYKDIRDKIIEKVAYLLGLKYERRMK